MRKTKVFYVESRNGVLDKNGGWTRLGSYSAAKFVTREAATAAFPAGVSCQVIYRNEDAE